MRKYILNGHPSYPEESTSHDCDTRSMILTTSKHDFECVCIHLTSRCSAPTCNHRFPVNLCHIALCLTCNTFEVPGVICGNVSELLFDWVCIRSN